MSSKKKNGRRLSLSWKTVLHVQVGFSQMAAEVNLNGGKIGQVLMNLIANWQ